MGLSELAALLPGGIVSSPFDRCRALRWRWVPGGGQTKGRALVQEPKPLRELLEGIISVP